MKGNHQSECGCCGAKEPVFLFHIRQRGIYRRLCTACVLKNHSGSFCPVCFEVYGDQPPAPRHRLMCLNCPSITHISCATTSSSSGSYQCPPCANPNYTFFNPQSSKTKTQANATDKQSEGTSSGIAIDKDSAKQLLAAAKISSDSMNKAASFTRTEAERRVRESALARKRAREALEELAFLEGRKTESKVKSEFDSSVSQRRGIQDRIGGNGIRKDDIVSGASKSGVKVGDNGGQIDGDEKSNGAEHSASGTEESL